MKYIVTHTSPDWDAIGSTWVIRTYLPGWQDAQILFVPAGQRVQNSRFKIQIGDALHQVTDEVIEVIGGNEYIHVDTGLGPLDHHQTYDMHVCGMSRAWEFVKKMTNDQFPKSNDHIEAIERIVKIIVQIDHFQEIFWGDATADYQEFSLIGVLDGLKIEKPNQDSVYLEFGSTCLNALVHSFENRIAAEKDIVEHGSVFISRWGKSIGFETLNDTVIKLSQKMGYNLVLRKDPRKGYVRIKLRPEHAEIVGVKVGKVPEVSKEEGDLTLAYAKLEKIDPEATWYLHVSKRMLLNGTPKNPDMVPTKLSLQELIKVLETI